MSHEQILERTVRSKVQGSGRQPIEAITTKGNFEENEPGEAENFTPRSSKGRLENSLRGTIRSEKSSANQGQATKAARTSKSSGKDRHSKVNTAKGPRDRRVRLSVSTAIQFYDIQDRLGFDQPSKAIEWLLKKAKPAIDELSQLPPVPVGESSHTAGLKEEESSARPTSEPLSPGSYQHYHFRQSPSLTPKEVRGEGSGQAHSSPGIWKQDAEFGPFDPEAGLTDSRAKARERARERVKDKSSGPSIAPQSHHEPFQHTFLGNQSSLFDSLYSSGPMRSSFTQLLQSPVPTAIIHSSSQNLLQNQFFSTLYPSQPDRSMQSSMFQQRGALQHDHILHGQPPPELLGGADLHRYHSFGSPFIQVPMISGGIFGGAQNVLQAASAMNPRHFRDDQVPFGRGYFSNSQQPGATINSTSVDPTTARQQDHHQQHIAGAPFVNRIPARIQGLDDMDEQTIQHPRSHHHHSSS